MKKKIRSALSLILTLAMIFSLSVPAFAAENEGGPTDEPFIGVEHVVSKDGVSEIATFSDGGDTSIVIRKDVFPDGTMDVFRNGVLVRTETGVNYEIYLAVAQGRYIYDTSSVGMMGMRATNPCGYDDPHHQQGPSAAYTINIPLTLNSLTIASIICEGLNRPVLAKVLEAVQLTAELALERGAKYVDVAATDFFIAPEGIGMYCTHAHFVFYDKDSNGNKDYVTDEWIFYQTLP